MGNCPGRQCLGRRKFVQQQSQATRDSWRHWKLSGTSLRTQKMWSFAWSSVMLESTQDLSRYEFWSKTLVSVPLRGRHQHTWTRRRKSSHSNSPIGPKILVRWSGILAHLQTSLLGGTVVLWNWQHRSGRCTRRPYLDLSFIVFIPTTNFQSNPDSK